MQDSVNRFNLNDSLISSYYLIWTVIYYIPPFILCILIQLWYVNLTFDSSKLILYIFSFVVLIFTYLTELTDFYATNYNLATTTDANINFNMLLTNLLNRYHPYLFYLCAAYFVYYVLKISIVYSSTKYSNNRNFENLWFYRSAYPLVKLGFSFLYLGAWWASQEGNWGGWWNSDSSEMLGLVLSLIPLSAIHWSHSYAKSYYLNKFILLIFILFSLFYYFLQINYELSSHNFGLQSFLFFNNNIFFFNLTLLLILWSLKLYQKSYYQSLLNKNANCKQNHNSKFYAYSKHVLNVFLLIWLALSLLPLLNTFKTQSQYSLDSTILQLYSLIQVYFYLYVLFLFFKLKYFFGTTGLVLSALQNSLITYLILIFYNRSTKIKYLHFIFLIFISINLSTSDWIFFYAKADPYYKAHYWLKSIYLSQNTVYVNEGFTLGKSFITANSNFQLSKSWTSLMTSNSADSDEFHLWFNTQTIVNRIYFLVDYLTSVIIIEFNEIHVLNLLALFLITGLKLINYWKRKYFIY